MGVTRPLLGAMAVDIGHKLRQPLVRSLWSRWKGRCRETGEVAEMHRGSGRLRGMRFKTAIEMSIYCNLERTRLLSELVSGVG